jgi:hypothetical protein
MLIHDAIKEAVACSKIFPVIPIAPWAGKPRALFMCKPLLSAIEQGKLSPDEKDRKRWATLEAAMSSFVEGDFVTDDLMKQLVDAKHEHWCLRSRKPKPSMRVFGRFAAKDVFIGTHVKLRSELGGMNSQEFEMEKLICEDHWKNTGLQEFFSAPPKFEYGAYMSNASKKVRVPS